MHAIRNDNTSYSVTLPPGKEIPFIFLKIETAYESVIPETKSITLNKSMI